MRGTRVKPERKRESERPRERDQRVATKQRGQQGWSPYYRSSRPRWMSCWRRASKPLVGPLLTVESQQRKTLLQMCFHIKVSVLWHDWVTHCPLLPDENGTLKDTSLVRMFLMMQPWYLPSTDMAKKLVLKYPLLMLPTPSWVRVRTCCLPSLWQSFT